MKNETKNSSASAKTVSLRDQIVRQTTLTVSLRDQIARQTTLLRESKNELSEQRVMLETERNLLLDAPLSKGDLKAFIGELIDAQGAQYPAASNMKGLFGRLAYPAARGPTSQDRGEGFDPKTSPIALRDIDQVLAYPINGAGIFGLSFDLILDNNGIMRNGSWGLCFFFGDIIKAKLAEQLDILFPGYKEDDADRVGPPVQERRARLERIAEEIAALDSKIADCDSQLTDLRQAMTTPSQAAGVTSAPTPQFAAQETDRRSPYRRGEVLKMTNQTLGGLYKLIEDEGFPKPVLNGDSDLYPALAVDNWLRARAVAAA